MTEHSAATGAGDERADEIISRAADVLRRMSQQTVVDLWQDLLDKDDRTSPEEYPDMALISFDEFSGYMAQTALSASRDQLRAKDAEIGRLTKALAGICNAAEVTLGLLGDVKSRDETLRWIVTRAKSPALKEQDQ